MSKAWQQTLLSSGLPLENDICSHLALRGCIGRFEYSYLKPDENSVDREFSYDVDASYIRGPYFMNLMIECKYRHPGARWIFAPAEYGGPDELEANDFLHVIDDFMTPKFAYRHRFPRTLAPLCSKGVELLADGANEKTITQATHQLAYALAPQLASSIDNQANRWLTKDIAFFNIPIIITTAELFRLNEATTIQKIREAREIEDVASKSESLVLKYFPGADLQRYNRKVLQAHLDRSDAKKLKSAFKSYTKDLSHWYSNLAGHQCPRAIVVISVAHSNAGLDRLFDYLDELVTPSPSLKDEIAAQEEELQEMVRQLEAHTKATLKRRAAK